MALKPTAISYKDNEDDRRLREWIHSHSNFSGFVKDTLRKVMNEENVDKFKADKRIVNSDDSNDLIDF